MNYIKNFKVYVHISPSNKYYVGITCQRLNGRWRNGNGYISSPVFYYAILKYGWDNFEHFVVAENLNENEAKNFEKVLIKKLRSTEREFGYNITTGGDGTVGRPCSKETRHKISIANTGKKCSELKREHQRSLMTGRKHSEETKLKIKQSNLNNKHNIGIKVVCLNTGEVFDSLHLACNKYNASRAGIKKACDGVGISSGKLNGEKLYWKYY